MSHLAHYHDDLMRDMRLNACRSPHFFAEYFAPVRPSRYRGVRAERRARLNRERPVAKPREVATN